MVSQCRYAFSRHSTINLGSFFLAEIRWMTSSFRPRGTVSASISVTNPCLYSRLASSAIALVAVGIRSPESSSLTLVDKPQKEESLVLQGRGQRDQVDGRRQGGLGQAGADQLDDPAFILQEVGQGDAVERFSHPLFQGLPQRPQRAVALVYAVAVGHGAGMALTIAGIVKKRLAQGQQHLAQADGRWITG